MDTCHVCNKEIVKPDDITTGYGIDKDDHKICFACCGIQDHEYMRNHDKTTLYLTSKDGRWIVSNWPGTLAISAIGYERQHAHNWGLSRRDVWFADEFGNHWHGVSYGDFTQLVHCRKLKHPVPELAFV